MTHITRFCALFLAAVVMIAAVRSHAQMPGIDAAPAETPESISSTVRMVGSFFRPVNGTVDRVEDGVVHVSVENAERLKKGMRLSVFREGEPFYHPLTNKQIGRVEELAGRIEVRGEQSTDGSYPCSLVRGDAQTGDIVRITSSNIKLAYFQDRKADWSISETFYRALSDSERFEIVDAFTPSFKPGDLAEKARSLGAEAVLLFSTGIAGGKNYINVQLFWAEDAEMFAEISEPVSEAVISSLSRDDEFIPSVGGVVKPWGTYEIREGRLLAVGDVDGNGTEEFVVSNGNNVRIYSLKDQFQELWHIQGSDSETHLSLDILDVNGNGTAEIFVTSLIKGSASEAVSDGMEDVFAVDSGRLRSYVIEYQPGEGYKKTERRIPYFFRVTGGKLLMQKYSLGQVFQVPVYEAEWKDGAYRPARPLKLPEGVNIYGFAAVECGSGGSCIVSYDDKGYVRLYDGEGNVMWESGHPYGKFELTFTRETYDIVDRYMKWSVRGDMPTIRTERGHEVVVVEKEAVIPKVPGLGYKGAEVYSLWWNGDRMERNLMMSGISGAVTDYIIDGSKIYLLARKDLFGFAKNIIRGEFSRDSIVYYYNFGE